MEYYYSEDLIQDVITIEGLRTFFNSCSTPEVLLMHCLRSAQSPQRRCGVSWHDDHISLDCGECGGYAMTRPCVDCDGKCDSVWMRNLTLTHEKQKASWEGECKLHNKPSTIKSAPCLSSANTTKSLSKNTLAPNPFLQTGLKVS